MLIQTHNVVQPVYSNEGIIDKDHTNIAYGDCIVDVLINLGNLRKFVWM